MWIIHEYKFQNVAKKQNELTSHVLTIQDKLTLIYTGLDPGFEYVTDGEIIEVALCTYFEESSEEDDTKQKKKSHDAALACVYYLHISLVYLDEEDYALFCDKIILKYFDPK